MESPQDLRERARHYRWLGQHTRDGQTRRKLETMAEWLQLRAAGVELQIRAFQRDLVRKRQKIDVG